jgi:LmbE family N-acetylglucosaminyl deacetylase
MPLLETSHLVLSAGFAAGGALTVAGIVLVGGALRRPRINREPIGDLLIVAAHQDDCVILAGELGAEAAREGGRVEVLYLTCGSDAPEDSRARTRLDEAVRAWSQVGVPACNVRSLNFPQSYVRGPSKISESQIDQAVEETEDVLRSQPASCTVILPAAGETHVDHRTLRRIAIRSLMNVGRDDLHVLESPEYNMHYSLLRSPGRSLLLVLRSFPLASRWIKNNARMSVPGFVDGGPGFRLPPVEERLELKRRMLREFESEDGCLLVSTFGRPDLFRPITNFAGALRSADCEQQRFWQFQDRFLGTSLVFLCTLIWAAIALLAAAAASAFATIGNATGVAAGLAAGGAAFWIAYKRRKEPQRALNIGSAGAGCVVGCLVSFA